MPELCRFQNIIIRMQFNDNTQHYKPHIHVQYAEYKAAIGIDGEILAGEIPARQYKLIAAWLILHEDELYKAWTNAVRGITFDKIKPLD